MRKVFISLFLFCLLALLSCKYFQSEPKGKALAEVNGQKLTQEEIMAELSLAFEDSIPFKAQEDYLNRWIDNELLYQEALKKNLKNTPEMKLRIRQAEKDIMVLSLIKDYTRGIRATENEAKEFYQQNPEFFRRDQEEFRASHILFFTQAQADSALALIKKGADFPRLAQELSLDSLTKNSGGDIGYFTLSGMHPLIAQKASELQIGMVSTPFQTEMGYHLLKLTDRKPKGSLRDFEQVKSRLIEQLSTKKRNEALTQLLDELRKKAKIKIEKSGWGPDS